MGQISNAAPKVKTRVILKHDTAINWSKAVGFVPLKGELVIYDIDDAADIARGYYESASGSRLDQVTIDDVVCSVMPSSVVRCKVGDGISNVNVLPFMVDSALVVTFDGQSQISHYAAEIYQQVAAGRKVILKLGEEQYYTLVESTPNQALFSSGLQDDHFIYRVLVGTDSVEQYETQVAPVEWVLDINKPIIVTYSNGTASKTASQIYSLVTAGNKVFIQETGKAMLWPLAASESTFALFNGPLLGEYDPEITRIRVDDTGAVVTYTTQLVCHYTFEDQTKPLIVTHDEEDDTLSEEFDNIYGDIQKGRTVLFLDEDAVYLRCEAAYPSFLRFGGIGEEDSYYRSVTISSDNQIRYGGYYIADATDTNDRLRSLEDVVCIDNDGFVEIATNRLYINATEQEIEDGIRTEGFNFCLDPDEPVTGAQQDQEMAAVVSLYGNTGDEKVRLHNIAPGIQDYDAATVGQVNSAVFDAAGKNLLNFYDPSKITVSYCSTKHIPGWQVRFDDSVTERSNEYFAGNLGMTEHKEITFTPSTNTVNIGLQTTNSLHENSCKVNNLTLTRTDGQPLGHLAASTTTFGQNETEVVHNDTFSGGPNGWVGVKGAGTGYGYTDSGGLLLEATGWNSAGSKTFTVTPGVLHTVSFYYKAMRNGLNVKICDGTSSSDTKLAGGYLSKTTWTLVSYTFIPTGNNIFVNFNGSNLGTADAPDSVWVDDFTVSKATGFTLWDGIIKNTSSNGQFSVTMSATAKSIRMKSNWSYWNEYIKIPLTGLSTTDTYVVRFRAAVTSNGVNLSGENINWITRDKSYIASNDYYIASFQPASAGTCYITFKGDGQSKDDVTISDIHIFNQNEPLNSIAIGNKRWITSGLNKIQGNTLLLKGNNKAYEYGLRTLAVGVEPDVEYKLSFDIEYEQAVTYQWQPYITFSDEDKIALVTDDCIPTEFPRCGGPWVGSIDSAHLLKIDIDFDRDDRDTYSYLFNNSNLLALQFLFGNQYNGGATVSAPALFADVQQGTESLPRYSTIGTYANAASASCWCNIPLSKTTVTASGLSVIFTPDVAATPPSAIGEPDEYCIQKLRLLAKNNDVLLLDESRQPFKIEPNKAATFYNRITAEQFFGVIDDGCLDLY